MIFYLADNCCSIKKFVYINFFLRGVTTSLFLFLKNVSVLLNLKYVSNKCSIKLALNMMLEIEVQYVVNRDNDEGGWWKCVYHECVYYPLNIY